MRAVYRSHKLVRKGTMLACLIDCLLVCYCRELIERNPEEFKIECLKQIRALFPTDHNPFHAGFGNKNSVRTHSALCVMYLRTLQPNLGTCVCVVRNT